MGIYALVDSGNKVVNAVCWDGVSKWRPGPDLTAINVDGIDAGIGYSYDPATGAFTPPPVDNTIVQTGPLVTDPGSAPDVIG